MFFRFFSRSLDRKLRFIGISAETTYLNSFFFYQGHLIICGRNNFRTIFFAWSPFVSTLFIFHVVSRTASEIVFAGNKTSRGLCPKCDRKACMDCLAGQNGLFQSQIVVYNNINNNNSNNGNNNNNNNSKIIAHIALFTIKRSIALYIRSIKSANKIIRMFIMS